MSSSQADPCPDKGLAACQIEHGGMVPHHTARAFTILRPHAVRVPILIAAPHGGRAYSDPLLSCMRDPAAAQAILEDRLIDCIASSVARQCGAISIIANAPRALVDLNRSPKDMDWTMVENAPNAKLLPPSGNPRVRGGLGLVPRRLSGCGELWKKPLTHSDVEQRLNWVHEPYHLAIERELIRLRDQWGAVLLLDLHSMPPLKRNPNEEEVHFVIGDRYGAACDHVLADKALRFFRKAGKGSTYNRPYSGGYVLDRHGRPHDRIHALQLEVCRSTYLDRGFAKFSARHTGLIKLLCELVQELSKAISHTALADVPSLAAE